MPVRARRVRRPRRRLAAGRGHPAPAYAHARHAQVDGPRNGPTSRFAWAASRSSACASTLVRCRPGTSAAPNELRRPLHARPYFKDAQLRRVPQYKIAVAVQTLERDRATTLVALAARVAPQREAQAAS